MDKFTKVDIEESLALFLRSRPNLSKSEIKALNEFRDFLTREPKSYDDVTEN